MQYNTNAIIAAAKDPVIRDYIVREQHITDVFFSNIVPILGNENIFLKRITDIRLDRIGIDAVLCHRNLIEFVDMKAHHSMTSLKDDYALELDTREWRTGGRHTGWFIHNNKITTAYIFIHWRGSSFTSINSMQVSIIRREDIMRTLRNHGINIYDWQSIISQPPSSINKGRRIWRIGTEGIRITHSAQLRENPVNIVVPWQILENASILTRNYIIE